MAPNEPPFKRGDIVLWEEKNGLGIVQVCESKSRVHVKWVVAPLGGWSYNDAPHRATNCDVWLGDFLLTKIGHIEVPDGDVPTR